MTDRYMDFDAARAEAGEADGDVKPVSFRLCGQDWHCRTDVPGSMLMDFILGDSGAAQLKAGKDLLVTSIVADERAAFEKVLREGTPGKAAVRANKAQGIKAQKAIPAHPAPSMTQLDEIIAWLVRELLARPSESE